MHHSTQGQLCRKGELCMATGTKTPWAPLRARHLRPQCTQLDACSPKTDLWLTAACPRCTPYRLPPCCRVQALAPPSACSTVQAGVVPPAELPPARCTPAPCWAEAEADAPDSAPCWSSRMSFTACAGGFSRRPSKKRVRGTKGFGMQQLPAHVTLYLMMHL